MRETVLEFSNVVKRFDDTLIVDGISFTVARGEFFTLLGPSGCGKTTTLRLLAGLEDPDAGEITLEGRCLAAPERGILVAPDKRGVGMMFQSYAIWPHLNVFENVAFPLRVRRVPSDVIRKRVNETLELVGLAGMGERGGTQLSGGQQQRVALARSIAHTPSLLLLDEPLSNLDVTHDQDEALALSDRIAILNKGRVEQVGTPVELYEHPRTRFVSEFLGRTIVINGTMRSEAGRSTIDVQGSGHIVMHKLDAQFSDGQAVRVLSRPEDIVLLPPGDDSPNQVAGIIERIAYMGNHLEYTISAAGRSLVLPVAKKDRYAVGAAVRLAFDPACITVLP
jgi:ABC-type Fe3+/spermidine/putrescine transport system ATPase subunit